MSCARPPGSVLITGATGFIGGRLAARLAAQGRPLRLLVRDPQRLPAALREASEIIVGDLGNTAALTRAVRDVQWVFHCAANVHTWDDAAAYEAANVLGTRHLLEALAAGNPTLERLVHFSTADVYGFPVQPCDESAPVNGAGFGYGDSKLRGESLVREFCATARLPYVILRPTNVIGPGSQFIERIGRELQSGLMLTVDGGRANAGILYVDNLLDWALWAARADPAVGECFNVRDPYDVTWAQFIRAFRSAIGGHGLVIDLPFALANGMAATLEQFHRAFLPSREPLLHRLLVRIFGRTCGHSAAKLRAASGLPGAVGFEDAIARSVRWYLEQRAPTSA